MASLLVTCCPECGTSFRVVDDQLRLRKGLVRCGVCSKIFDANAYLQTIPEPVLTQTGDVDIDTPDLNEWEAELAQRTKEHSGVRGTSIQPVALTQEVMASSVPEDALSDGADVVIAKPVAHDSDMESTVTADDADLVNAIEFLQKSPNTPKELTFKKRLIMISSIIVLCIVLILQVLWWFREPLVGIMPGIRPVAMLFCQDAQCYNRLPRHLEALSIESSSLLPVASIDPQKVHTEGSKFEASLEPQSYIIHLVLRNRHSDPQNWPAIEISLTDAQDQMLSRRVVLAADYVRLQKDKLMLANKEYSLSIPLKVTTPAVDGYRIAIFYP